MKTYEEKFAFNIQRLRRSAMLTQKQLAEALGYSEKTVSKWECGGAIPGIETLYKIASVLRTDIDGLFQEKHLYLLGIDGGGSKTDFVLTDLDFNVVHKVHAGGCNPIDSGMEETKKVLRDGIYAVCGDIPFSSVVMFAGIAGGSSAGTRESLEEFFGSFGFGAYKNGSDTQNILSAGLGDRDGVIIIMGTGNCAIAQRGGKQERISGWGYLFDDGASGYSIARDALAAHFRYTDGSGGYTSFSDAVSKDNPDPQKLLGFLYDGGKRVIASFCPAVFECAEGGDEICCEIIRKNMAFAANIIRTAAKAVGGRCVDVVLAGALSALPLAIDCLMQCLPDEDSYNITVLSEPPVSGALIYAKKILEELK